MKKEFTIEIKGKEWEEAQDQAFQKAVKTVKIDGFRKGKVPKDIFLKKYGKESLYLDAADRVLPKAYDKMLKEHKDDELVAQPDITLKSIDDKKVVFQFVLITRPEVKLKKYKGLKVKKDKVEATKEEIDEVIENMRNRFAEIMPKENKTVEDGDTAIIDFEGFRDGKAFDGGKGENYNLKIGSHTFIPGFEEQLIGMKTGEEKEIEVTFPKDYHSDDLKGKKATFKVKVNDVKTTVIPELGEEFFEDLGMDGVDSLESLQKEIKGHIISRKEADVENKFIDDLLDKVCENMEVEIPKEMLEEEITRLVKRVEENLKLQGLTLTQFYQFTNSDEAALREQVTEEAKKRILSRFVLEEVAKAEKIEISDKDAKKEQKEMKEKYHMTDKEFEENFGDLEMVKYDMKMRKALEVLKENNE